MDSSGNLYIADSGNDTVREMNTSTGIIITLAGNGTYSSAYPSGSATSQGLGLPCCVALNSTGQLYITDGDANLILALSGGTLSVVAGTGSSGYSGEDKPPRHC
jgi:DNA-binding beta-propeller fold protein YncE